jgi:DNA-binding transcriptional ArsR family regulator
MTNDEFTPAETLELRGLATLKVMADPRRKQIVNLLRSDAATVKGIADSLQLSPKSLYYHVNLLEKHGLIRVVDTRLVSGIVEKRYRATAYLFMFNELNSGEGATAASRALEAVSSIFAITTDDIRIGLESGAIDPGDDAGTSERLSLEWNLIDLSDAKRDELEKRLRELFEEYASHDSDDSEQHAFRYISLMFPTRRQKSKPQAPPRQKSGAGEK